MIEYPSELPLPQRAGYGFKPVDPTLRTPMQSGRTRARRQYGSTPTVAPVTWRLSAEEAQLFESWYEDVLVSGTQWFECLLKTPQGLTQYKARFAAIYDGPHLVGLDHWDIRAQLELWERPILRGGWALYAPEFMRHMSLLDIAINREWPES